MPEYTFSLSSLILLFPSHYHHHYLHFHIFLRLLHLSPYAPRPLPPSSPSAVSSPISIILPSKFHPWKLNDRQQQPIRESQPLPRPIKFHFALNQWLISEGLRQGIRSCLPLIAGLIKVGKVFVWMFVCCRFWLAVSLSAFPSLHSLSAVPSYNCLYVISLLPLSPLIAFFNLHKHLFLLLLLRFLLPSFLLFCLVKLHVCSGVLQYWAPARAITRYQRLEKWRRTQDPRILAC